MSKSLRLECSTSRQKTQKTMKLPEKQNLYQNDISIKSWDAPSWSSINVAVKEIIFKAKPFKNKKKEISSNKILEAKK